MRKLHSFVYADVVADAVFLTGFQNPGKRPCRVFVQVGEIGIAANGVVHLGDESLIAIGHHLAIDAAAKLENVSVIKINQLWPIDPKLIQILSSFDHVVYISEEEKAGSIGESIASELSGKSTKVHIMAPHGFVEQGSINQLRQMLSLDADSITDYCRKECNYASKTTT